MSVCHDIPERRRGFATFTAVVLITFVSMALMSLTMLLQADSRRTTHHWAETQLRQLLIAGGAAAVHAVSADPQVTGTRVIQPPATIENANLTVSYEHDGEAVLRATVTARIDVHEARQTLTFETTYAGWVLRDIQLDRHH